MARKKAKKEKAVKKTAAELRAEKAVAAYTAAKGNLYDFLHDEDIEEIISEMTDLIERYNAALDEAVREVKLAVKSGKKDRLAIGGIGAQKKVKRQYDAEYLKENLDEDMFSEVVEEIVRYKVNSELLEQLARQDEIDADVVSDAYSEEEQNPSALPGTPKPIVMVIPQ